MIHLADGRPVILKEFGYSSGYATGSSEEQQRLFFINALDAIRRSSGAVLAANAWAFQDMPPAIVDFVIQLYGMDSNQAATSFLGSLGLNTSGGAPKPAWFEFAAGAAAFSVTRSCSTPRWEE
jgi:hypothetical protein